MGENLVILNMLNRRLSGYTDAGLRQRSSLPVSTYERICAPVLKMSGGHSAKRPAA